MTNERPIYEPNPRDKDPNPGSVDDARKYGDESLVLSEDDLNLFRFYAVSTHAPKWVPKEARIGYIQCYADHLRSFREKAEVGKSKYDDQPGIVTQRASILRDAKEAEERFRLFRSQFLANDPVYSEPDLAKKGD